MVVFLATTLGSLESLVGVHHASILWSIWIKYGVRLPMKNQSNKSSERSARHIFACSLLVAGCGVFATGCAGDDAGNDMPDGEGQFSVSVGALSPGDIADACYALTATNEAGDVV
jgi:hypothetical protein